jgi:hypothetical protein
MLELLHIYKILKENFWAIVNPFFFAFIGFLFNIHEQETELRKIAHIMNAGIFLMVSFSKTIEICISLYFNEEHLKNQKKTIFTSYHNKCWSKIFCCFFSTTNDFNPIYTNPVVYKTFFPMLTASLITLNGLWWLQMAFSLFLGSINNEMETGHHGISTAYSMMYNQIFAVILFSLTISLIFHKIDKKWYQYTLILNEEEMNSLNHNNIQ